MAKAHLRIWDVKLSFKIASTGPYQQSIQFRPPLVAHFTMSNDVLELIDLILWPKLIRDAGFSIRIKFLRVLIIRAFSFCLY